MSRAGTVDVYDAADRSWDVAIAGAGPAGSLLARQLALAGKSVILIDKASFPRSKVCGCCLSGSALAALQMAGLGNLAAQNQAIPIRQLTLAAGGRVAVLPLSGGVALSRARLDTALIDAAIQAGAAFLPETRIASRSDPGQFDLSPAPAGQRYRLTARAFVAADGLSASVLPDLGPSRIVRHSRVGAGAIANRPGGYFEPGVIYMGCGAEGYVGLTRLEDGRLDIAAALRPEAVRTRGMGAAAAAVLAGTGWPPIEDWRQLVWKGTPALTRSRRRCQHGQIFALGDSAGYVEPFTGEGIAWALHSALKLAPIIVGLLADPSRSTRAEWQRARQRLLGRRQRSCRLLALTLRSPLLTQWLVRSLSLAPALARPLLHQLNRAPRFN